MELTVVAFNNGVMKNESDVVVIVGEKTASSQSTSFFKLFFNNTEINENNADGIFYQFRVDVETLLTAHAIPNHYSFKPPRHHNEMDLRAWPELLLQTIFKELNFVQSLNQPNIQPKWTRKVLRIQKKLFRSETIKATNKNLDYSPTKKNLDLFHEKNEFENM